MNPATGGVSTVARRAHRWRWLHTSLTERFWAMWQTEHFRGNPRTILRFYRVHLLEAIVALLLMLLQLVLLLTFPGSLWDPARVEVLLLMLFTLFPISVTIVRLPVLVGMERRCRELVQSFERAEQRVDHMMMSLLHSQAGRDVRLLSGLLAFWYGFSIFWESAAPPCRGMDAFTLDVLPCDTLACSCIALCSVNIVLFSASFLAPSMIRLNRDHFIPQRHKGIPLEMVRQLPTYEIGRSTAPVTTAECYICLEEFAVGDSIRSLPCGHEFHCHCVDGWLSRAPSCPLRCRHDIWDALGSRRDTGNMPGSTNSNDTPASGTMEDTRTDIDVLAGFSDPGLQAI